MEENQGWILFSFHFSFEMLPRLGLEVTETFTLQEKVVPRISSFLGLLWRRLI